VSVAQAELLFEPTGYPAAAFRIAPAASTTSTTNGSARYGGLSPTMAENDRRNTLSLWLFRLDSHT
jgi:hypothetical protein